MTTYKNYAIKLDTAFKTARSNYSDALAELTNAKTSFEEASTSRKPEAYWGERANRVAVAKANYLEAKNIFENTSRSIWNDYKNTVSELTKELNEAVTAYYSVKPELVDDSALALLNSGIMTPDDIFRMGEKYSDNPTMRRLIADYAGKMANNAEFESNRVSLGKFSAELTHEKDNIIRDWNALVRTAEYCTGCRGNGKSADFVARMNQHWDEISEKIHNL